MKQSGNRRRLHFPDAKESRGSEEVHRQLEALEYHPVIGGPLTELVAVSMNLAMNLRSQPVDRKAGIISKEVSSGLIHRNLVKINRLIEKQNESLPEGEKISRFTPEEFFVLILTRAK